MKRILIFAVLAVTATSSLLAASVEEEGRLLRFPSTNGTEVVFSYAGDLYKASIYGGRAVRLTSHPGYEMFARFSPDGTQIAFTGQYDGSTEVYVMPSEGGAPRRLTYTATNPRDNLADRMGPNNVVMCWTPDGKGVVYRNRISDSFDGKLYIAPVDGGMPEQIPLPEGGFCSYSPDGSKLAYNRVFREFRTWKYYKGGMADEVWIYNPEAATVTQVTDNEAQDVFPMWVGEEIFFASDRDNRMNIFVYNTITGETEKVTDFEDYDVKFPSTDGKTIVFENGGNIYRLDPTTRRSEKIDIKLSAEGNYARPETRNVANFMTSFELAPDGSRIMAVARGDVFNLPVKNGVTRNLTRTSGVHERLSSWSPDGKIVYYISDATGETELYSMPAEGGEETQLTYDNDSYITGFEVSPDGKTIVYSDRRNRLITLTLATKAKKVIAVDSVSAFRSYKFSPDSRWLTYTRSSGTDNRTVCLYDLTAAKEYAVTDAWYDSSEPSFSTDGRYLVFASARDFNPIYSDTEWNHAYIDMEGIYLVTLAADTPSPFIEKDDKVVVEGSDQPESKSDKDTKDDAMRVDTDGIADRIIKLPIESGSYWHLYCDGSRLYYCGGDYVGAFDFDTKQVEHIDAIGFAVSADGRKIIYVKDRDFYVTDYPASSPSFDKPIDRSNMVATIDYTQEWAQIYDEAWRAFRDGFYLENMHGVDWQAMKEKYAVLLPYVKCRQDLTYVIGELIGELACGHAYVGAGDFRGINIVKTGMLGAKLSSAEGGYFRIDHILQGASHSQSLFSPLTEQGLDVNEGDYIVAVDGVPTNTVANIYSLLEGKAGVPTELSINGSPSIYGARKIVIKPIADEFPLYHYEWVQNNIRIVNEATDGRVGYIYVPDMGPEGLNEFSRYYYPQLDKEALIIDDRGNGGGNVSPMLIERLLRKPYRMTMYRGSNRNEMIPYGTSYGPKVLLINKYSASDGDLFPYSFKAVGLGTVIGTRTWGGIIGISGSLSYIDGTDIRVPFFTNYSMEGEWIVENHGVDPDILIDNDPILEQAGEDQQLNKAIEVVLEQLKERKPLPTTPAPRTRQDLGYK